jgi:hypothetical protein
MSTPRPPSTPPAPPEASLIDQLGALWSELRRFLIELAELAQLEARQAGLRLAMAVGCGVAAGIAIVTAWIFICASIAAYAIEHGVSLSLAIAGAALLNIILAGVAGFAMVQYSRHILFPATRRQLNIGPLIRRRPPGHE